MDKKLEELLSEEKNKDNVVPFARPSLITGGMDGTGPWLMNMPLGAMVEVIDRVNRKDFRLPVFTILHKTDKSVRIVNPQHNIDDRVDPTRFCNQYDFVSILCIVDIDSVIKGIEEEKEEENHNDPEPKD